MHLSSKRFVSKVTPEIIAVGGGKGGVGKTCFSANLAVEIGQKGWRVILVDCDLSCSNLDTVLGANPEQRLDHFFHQRGTKDLDGVAHQTEYTNVRLVAGTTGLLDVANPRFQQKEALTRELQRLDADVVIADLGAGAHLNTLDFFLVTESNGIVVLTPEKTSIDNAFKFLRSALYRKIERFYKSPEVAALLRHNVTLREFIRAVREADAFDPAVKRQICGEMVALAKSMRPKLVVNRVNNEYEAQLTSNILSKSLREHLMIEPEYLGCMVFDTVVSEAVNSGVPFVMSHPRRPISSCIAEMVNRLGYI